MKKMKFLLLLITLLTTGLISHAQNDIRFSDNHFWNQMSIGKGDATITSPNAWLEIGKYGTNKTIILPRVNIFSVTGEEGSFGYDINSKSLWYNDGSNWLKLFVKTSQYDSLLVNAKYYAASGLLRIYRVNGDSTTLNIAQNLSLSGNSLGITGGNAVSLTTSNVSEGSNLYYTATRVKQVFTMNNGITYDNVAGTVKLGGTLLQNTNINLSGYTFNIANGAYGVLKAESDGTITFASYGARNDGGFQGKVLFVDENGVLKYGLSNYLTSEVDPIFNQSPAGTITNTHLNNWNTAYNKKINSIGYSGNTLTLTQQDGSTLTTPITLTETDPTAIKNQTTVQSSANFNISGNGTLGGTLTSNRVNIIGSSTGVNNSAYTEFRKSNNTRVGYVGDAASYNDDVFLTGLNGSNLKFYGYTGDDVSTPPTMTALFSNNGRFVFGDSTLTGTAKFRVKGSIQTDSISVGIATPATPLHVIGTSGAQARIGSDASNYYSIAVNNLGLVTFSAVGSQGQFAFNNRINGGAGIVTGSTTANANFSVPSSGDITTSADSKFLLNSGGGIGTAFRVGMAGGTTGVPIPNGSITNLLTARTSFTSYTAGTHPVASSIMALAPILVNGGASFTNGATVYIDDAPTGAINNYSLLVNSGVARFNSKILANDSLTVNGVVRFSNGSPAAGKIWVALDTDGNGTWSNPSSGGISTLNTLTTTTQTFATGTAGTNFNISSSGSVHTFNIPDASGSNRGAVTTGSQTFAGTKTFTSSLVSNGVILNNNGGTGFESRYNNSSSGVREIKNPGGAYYVNNGANITGAIVIKMPFGYNSTMLSAKLKFYNYSTGQGGEIIVGGYNFATTPAWLQTFSSVIGQNPFDGQVRLGHDGTNNVIIIGDESTLWNYPKIYVEELLVSGAGTTAAWETGWTTSLVTDLSSYTIVNPVTNNYLARNTVLGVAPLDANGLVPSTNLGTGTPNNTTALFGDQVYRAVALATGGSGYIQNQSATTQSANYWISGIGKAGGFTMAGGSGALNFKIQNASNLNRWAMDISGTESSGQAGSNFRILSYADDGTTISATAFAITRSTGNVGIGNSSPASKLHIQSINEQFRVGFDASTNYTTLFVNSTGVATFNAFGSSASFAFSDDVNVTGNLTTTGSVTAQGGGFNSLRTLKEDISIYQGNALKIIDALKLYNFKYKSNNKDSYIGMVIDNKNEVPKELLMNDGTAINTYNTLSLLIKSIQQLNDRIDVLEKQIKKTNRK